MISVARTASPPAALTGPEADSARAEAEAWAVRMARPSKTGTSAKAAGQRPFQPRPFVRGASVEDGLTALFAGKCAFCETPLDPAGAAVTWYRPPSAAVGPQGEVSLPHYAWLAYDWDNLYVSCGHCDRARGRRFPVAARRRAAVGARGGGLDAERPLLLDPCRDDCDDHLVFTDDGRVGGGSERGTATVRILDLNRSSLVSGRRAAVEALKAAWPGTPPDELLVASEPYAAARRQAARRLQEAGAAAPRARAGAGAGHLTVGNVRLRSRTRAEERSAVAAEADARATQAAYTLEDRATDASYFATARYVERVEVRNFRPIGRLDLTAPPGRNSAGWLMLVGENAAGKSSFLTAVALTLMGQRARDALGLDAREYVRHGARRGSVKVWLTGLDEPVALAFDRRDRQFSGTAEPKVLLLGYGATRLLPRARHATGAPSPDVIADFDNLFDPFVPLVDATAWLLSLPDDRFTAAARGLAALLETQEGDALTRHPAQHEVRLHKRLLGGPVAIEQLSDGYQSVVAMAVDIMAVLFNRWPDLAAAEGVVVVDELGAHLHPRWRMRIVGRLRECFPRVQFLATTHDPLCLRGLGDGEAVVLDRLDDARRTVVARTDLPSIAGMRADQLLTSEFFGLRSTIDPEIEAQFDEYFRLKALRSRRPEQEARLVELSRALEPLRVLGETPRERLAFEAAELYLADYRTTKGPLEAAQVKESARRSLRDIWAEAAPERFA